MKNILLLASATFLLNSEAQAQSQCSNYAAAINQVVASSNTYDDFVKTMNKHVTRDLFVEITSGGPQHIFPTTQWPIFQETIASYPFSAPSWSGRSCQYTIITPGNELYLTVNLKPDISLKKGVKKP